MDIASFIGGAFAVLIAWPIVTTLAFIAILLVLHATEHEFVGTGLLVIVLGFLGYGLVTAGAAIPWALLGIGFVAYIAAGFAFTYPKFQVWTRKMSRLFAEKHAYFFDAKSSAKDYEVRNTTFPEWWNLRFSKGVYKVRPEAIPGVDPALQESLADSEVPPSEKRYDVYFEKSNLVGYLTSWVLNWPLYLILLAIEDFVIELMHWFAERIGGHFKALATAAFNDALASNKS